MFDLFGIKARKQNAYLMHELVKCKDAMTEARQALNIMRCNQNHMENLIARVISDNERLTHENAELVKKLQSYIYDINFPNSTV